MFSFWKSGLNPDFKEHSDYLDKITDDAEKKLKQLINDMIRADKKNTQDNLRLEVKQHLLFCQSKCADFKGREDTLKVGHFHHGIFLLGTYFVLPEN